MSAALIDTASPFTPPQVILPNEVNASMPASLVRESAYCEQLGLDRSLYPVYHSLERVYRRLEEKAEGVERAEQLRGLGEELVALERTHKRTGCGARSSRRAGCRRGRRC